MNKAIFLDRDGTIIEDIGSLADPAKVEFYPGSFAALRRLQDKFLLILVTNQRCIADGQATRAQVDAVNDYVVARLADEGITITGVYVCPHKRSDGCECIKPNTFFAKKAAEQYNIDLRGSFSIGDHPHDVQLGVNAGGQGVYVMTGHGVKHFSELGPDTIVTDGITEAADYILSIDI
ncbi:MAG: HAD family hydrolase [Phycisphaerae bacterium]|jgi:D-glycero-D-manno-heptose 1,7-bisphosphate phosphatase|nr:HAD family hydrolase [Phycisphaerae bacterium]MDP7286800.1 HAD family hydrolase [Phycisphaerae bacterium]